ncbi:MAG: hypothetical protein ABSG43_20635 [Solirubrobacteraceae bacterium]
MYRCYRIVASGRLDGILLSGSGCLTGTEPVSGPTGPTSAGATLSCSSGTWTVQPMTVVYRWVREGTPIPGAASRLYRVREVDEGTTLVCDVTAYSGSSGGACWLVHVSGPLVYSGHAFSIDYPAGWKLENREKRQSWGGTDTTIVFPGHPNALIRIDVRPVGGPNTPAAAAQPVIKSTSQEPGYRQLELSSGTLDGYPAIRWQFLVTESGAVMREEDDFIVDPKNGANVAVLTEAPVDEYPSLAAEFAAVRRSLTIK